MNDETHNILITRPITDNEIVLLASGWTAIFFMLMLVLITYFLGWQQSKPRSKALLGLVIFFAAVEIQVLYTAIITWTYLVDHTLVIPEWTQIRVVFLLFASCFVFYTTWVRKKPIKVVEVHTDGEPKRRISDI